MTYHILNGDSLAQSFLNAQIQGEVVVCREALIDGNVQGGDLQDLWRVRAKHHGIELDEYKQIVVSEYKKIIDAPNNSQFNLWFGYDLFSQVNMWFILSILFDSSKEKNIFVVYPTFLEPADIWYEFGNASTENLLTSLNNK